MYKALRHQLRTIAEALFGCCEPSHRSGSKMPRHCNRNNPSAHTFAMPARLLVLAASLLLLSRPALLAAALDDSVVGSTQRSWSLVGITTGMTLEEARAVLDARYNHPQFSNVVHRADARRQHWYGVNELSCDIQSGSFSQHVEVDYFPRGGKMIVYYVRLFEMTPPDQAEMQTIVPHLADRFGPQVPIYNLWVRDNEGNLLPPDKAAEANNFKDQLAVDTHPIDIDKVSSEFGQILSVSIGSTCQNCMFTLYDISSYIKSTDGHAQFVVLEQQLQSDAADAAAATRASEAANAPTITNPPMPPQTTASGAGTFLIGGGILIMALPLLGVIAFIFWIWMLIDCVKNPALVDNQKIVWILIVVFLNGFGALLYFFIARSKKGRPA